MSEETGLRVTAIQRYLGHFDYTSGSGKASRQFNFAVDVEATKPIELQEHDVYQWARLDDDVPVTEAVKTVIKAYPALGEVDEWSAHAEQQGSHQSGESPDADGGVQAKPTGVQ
ncbi:NUDIX hydrolase [Amycolatopsis sp. NPDC004772]